MLLLFSVLSTHAIEDSLQRFPYHFVEKEDSKKPISLSSSVRFDALTRHAIDASLDFSNPFID